MDKNISFTLKVWRQKGPKAKGAFETYQMKDIPGDTSFLEMLDILNEQLISEGKEPVVFDHDCREGICGMCSLHIDGHALVEQVIVEDVEHLEERGVGRDVFDFVSFETTLCFSVLLTPYL